MKPRSTEGYSFEHTKQSNNNCESYSYFLKNMKDLMKLKDCEHYNYLFNNIFATMPDYPHQYNDLDMFIDAHDKLDRFNNKHPTLSLRCLSIFKKVAKFDKKVESQEQSQSKFAFKQYK